MRKLDQDPARGGILEKVPYGKCSVYGKLFESGSFITIRKGEGEGSWIIIIASAGDDEYEKEVDEGNLEDF